MTREVKIGAAVAGSFLSLVGIVVGTKMYKGDIPKIIPGEVASADPSKKGDETGIRPPDTPGTLPATFLDTSTPPSFPPASPGATLPPPGLPSPPPGFDPKGFTLPPLPDPAKTLQDTINEQKKLVVGAVDKTKNDLNNAASSIVNDNTRRLDELKNNITNDVNNKTTGLVNAGNAKLDELKNQAKSAIDTLPGLPPPSPGNPSFPAAPVGLPGFPAAPASVAVADNQLINGTKPPAPPVTSIPAPAPAPAPSSTPSLPGLPEPPAPPGTLSPTPSNGPFRNPDNQPFPPGAPLPGQPPFPPSAPTPAPTPAPTSIVGDPVPKSSSLPPLGSPSNGGFVPISPSVPPAGVPTPPAGFPTPPAPPAGSPGGVAFPTPTPAPTPPFPPIESPATPIVGGTPTPTPAPPVSLRPDPTPMPPVGSPPSPPAPFGSTPPPPFGGTTTPVPPAVGGFVPAPTPPLSPPAAPAPVSTSVKTDTPERYTCQGAETFANLSVRKYGNENFARALAEYNRDMPGAAENLRESPPRLYPGTVVWLPSQNYLLTDRYARFVNPGATGSATLPPAPPGGTPFGRPLGSDIGISPPTPISAVPASQKPAVVNDVGITTYRVPAGGQYFSQIAERQLGSPLRWIDIYRLNQTLPPEQPIREGTEIRIPVK